MADINQCEFTLFFSRHAEKSSTKDKDPPLTEQGSTRALALAARLSTVPIQAVYATNYQRTQNTAKPTADAKKLAVKIYDAAKSNEFVQNLLNAPCAGPVLVVGHSNTLPSMLRAAGIHEVATEFDENLYGMLYIVTRNQDGVSVEIEQYGD